LSSEKEVIHYKDISEIMRRFLGAFEGYRRLGFLPEQIYLETRSSVALGGKIGAFAALKAQGKEFFMELGPVRHEKKLGEEYKRVATAVREQRVSPKDLDRIWQESICCTQAESFHTALVLKGFTFPRRTN
jgi:hypothetical protein